MVMNYGNDTADVKIKYRKSMVQYVNLFGAYGT